jgi:hypothetical protein
MTVALRLEVILKMLFAMFSMALLVACEKPVQSSTVQFQYQTDKGTATLELSRKYAEASKPDIDHNNGLLWIYFSYPSMQPLIDQSASNSNDIHLLLIAKSSTTKAPVESWLENIRTDHYLEDKPGMDYSDGVMGDYRVFRGGAKNALGISNTTYYVFNDVDGNLVQVESDSYSTKYVVEKTLIPSLGGLTIKYLYEKKLGDDFKKIDSDVSLFIKSFIKK